MRKEQTPLSKKKALGFTRKGARARTFYQNADKRQPPCSNKRKRGEERKKRGGIARKQGAGKVRSERQARGSKGGQWKERVVWESGTKKRGEGGEAPFLDGGWFGVLLFFPPDFWCWNGGNNKDVGRGQGGRLICLALFLVARKEGEKARRRRWSGFAFSPSLQKDRKSALGTCSSCSFPTR